MKKSFTLIELIIYIALAAIILNVGIYFIWQIIGAKTKIVAYSEVLNNARFILEKISFEAKRARLLVTPANQGQESQELLLRLTDGSDVRFHLIEDGKLILERAGQTLPLTSEKVRVTTISFKNLSPQTTRPATFQVKMQLNYYNPLKRIEYKAEISTQKTINLRDNPTP